MHPGAIRGLDSFHVRRKSISRALWFLDVSHGTLSSVISWSRSHASALKGVRGTPFHNLLVSEMQQARSFRAPRLPPMFMAVSSEVRFILHRERVLRFDGPWFHHGLSLRHCWLRKIKRLGNHLRRQYPIVWLRQRAGAATSTHKFQILGPQPLYGRKSHASRPGPGPRTGPR